VSLKEYIPAHLSLHLVGIVPQGLLLARLIGAEYHGKFGSELPVHALELDKIQPSREGIRCSDVEELRGAAVLLTDDVLNSGRTMAFALSYLLDFQPAMVKTAVLVDRDHKTFPIAADYCGLRLATSLEDHVRVELNGRFGAWLE
jgi:pyrimidine operon attenuation protein/uracil phosphoribosyltransferase